MDWFRIGKNRTEFGEWLDKSGIKQLALEDASGLSRRTISRLCNDNTYRPKISTIQKVLQGLHKLGKNVKEQDFWSM